MHFQISLFLPSRGPLDVINRFLFLLSSLSLSLRTGVERHSSSAYRYSYAPNPRRSTTQEPDREPDAKQSLTDDSDIDEGPNVLRSAQRSTSQAPGLMVKISQSVVLQLHEPPRMQNAGLEGALDYQRVVNAALPSPPAFPQSPESMVREDDPTSPHLQKSPDELEKRFNAGKDDNAAERLVWQQHRNELMDEANERRGVGVSADHPAEVGDTFPPVPPLHGLRLFGQTRPEDLDLETFRCGWEAEAGWTAHGLEVKVTGANVEGYEGRPEPPRL